VREPGAEVQPGPPAEIRHARGVLGDHPLGGYLANEVSEALCDAARQCSLEAEHKLRGYVDVAVLQECEVKPAPL
jgi:hypothetical protein